MGILNDCNVHVALIEFVHVPHSRHLQELHYDCVHINDVHFVYLRKRQEVRLQSIANCLKEREQIEPTCMRQIKFQLYTSRWTLDLKKNREYNL